MSSKSTSTTYSIATPEKEAAEATVPEPNVEAAAPKPTIPFGTPDRNSKANEKSLCEPAKAMAPNQGIVAIAVPLEGSHSTKWQRLLNDDLLEDDLSEDDLSMDDLSVQLFKLRSKWFELNLHERDSSIAKLTSKLESVEAELKRLSSTSGKKIRALRRMVQRCKNDRGGEIASLKHVNIELKKTIHELKSDRGALISDNAVLISKVEAVDGESAGLKHSNDELRRQLENERKALVAVLVFAVIFYMFDKIFYSDVCMFM